MRAAILLALALGPAPAAVAGGPSRNVVLISIDALRSDHLSFHGYPRPTMPALERLVEAGAAVFERMNAVSASCGPAHAALLSGQHPQRIGVPYGGEDLVARSADLRDPEALDRLAAYQERLQRSTAPLVRKKLQAVEGWLRVPAGTWTLASALSRAGYRTAAFVSHWTVAGRFGYGQGFDLYDDDAPDYTGPGSLAWLLRDTFGSHRRRPAAATVDAALEYLGSREEQRPFFLFVHLADAHEPVSPSLPASFGKRERAEGERAWTARYTGKGYNRALRRLEAGGEHLLDRYDDALREMDRQIGRLLRALEAAGEWERTLLIVTSDHGQAFGEHPYQAGGDGPFFDHGLHLWEEIVDVPLVIAGGGLEGPARREDVASTVDVVPTVLAQLGVEPPSGLAGRDLRQVPTGPRRVYFSAFGTWRPGLFRDLFFEPPRLVGFRELDLKFWMTGARFEDEGAGKAFLFQLGADPSERNDVSTTEVFRPHVQRYRKELRRWYLESIAPASD